LVFKNAESEVEQFAPNSATDSQIRELSALQSSNPRLKRLTPTPRDSGRQIKSCTQQSVADFAKVSFAVKKTARTELGRSQPGISS
jgi:hypothetical protein